MPPPVSTFVGREQEIARLERLVREHRLVTVVGPGGMGKTRIADEVCPRLEVTFPGSIRRCELALVSPRDDIGVAVAGPLGFLSVDALLVGLGDAPSLLVLDNCEHIVGAVARFCEQVLDAAPALRVLATSRELLGVDGEQVLVLGPLTLPGTSEREDLASASATRLFEDRARGAGARRDASPEELAARAELCRRLDGVPLAIELAAARARSLTAVEILALLGRRFDLLQRSAPVGRARHRSLRAAIDASYTLLDAEEQAFFRALGVFAGPFSAALAQQVAAPQIDRLHTLDLLARLVDRSLVVAEPARGVTRYRLLDSLRDYAADAAVAAGEWDTATDRFVAAMIAEADAIVVAGATRWSSELLANVLAHFDALAAAIDRTIEVDRDASRAFRLLLPLWGATHQGRAAEVAAIGDRVLLHWPDGSEPLRAEATAVAASALLAAGRVERATSLARSILPGAAASPLARVVALRTLGIAARHDGDEVAAVDHFVRARTAAAETGLAAFERELAVFVASTPPGDDALDAMVAELDAVAAQAAAENDPIGVVWAQIVATHQLLRAGRLAEARAALERALHPQQGFDYPYGAKAGLRMRATLEALEHGWAASRATWLETFDRCAVAGDLAELGLALRAAAVLARRDGDDAASDALLAAVPGGVHPTVLGDVFEAERGADARAVAIPGERPHTGVTLRRVRELLSVDVPARPEAGARTGSDAQRSGALIRAGDGWTVRFADETRQVRHMKGLDDLAALLARPDEEIHCLELMGGSDVGGGAGPVLDERARREYQTRIRDLQTEIDRARDANDIGHAERAEAELDALVQQLAESFGLGGRARATGSAAERARSAVTWRIRAATKRLGEVHPDLGRHLANAVRTGTWCSYRPESAVAWQIRSDASIQPRSS